MASWETIQQKTALVYFREARTTVAAALKNLGWVTLSSSAGKKRKERVYSYESVANLVAEGADRSLATPRYWLQATKEQFDDLLAELDRLEAAGYEGGGIEIYGD